MELKNKIRSISIDINASILQALQQMDEIYKHLLLVFDGENFIGLLSIGDIQRAIIKGESLNFPIKGIIRDDVRVANVLDLLEDVKNEMIKHRIECMPVVDDENKLVDVIFWEELTSEKRHNKVLLDIPVVIMAGGKGARLKPITNIIPKPLVPVGEKAMIHIIIEKFMSFGCKLFYISIGYKGDMIKQHLNELNLPCTIHYFEEDKPLGTAGSLSIIKEKLTSNFVISNCDILINQDYEEVLNYHVKAENLLTAIAALKSFDIPYGVLETKENGQLIKMKEKPSFNFQVNAGVYFLNQEALKLLPDNKFYNITDLMDDLLKKNKKVGVFPVNEGSWFDIGEWKEYQKTQEIFEKIEL